MKPFRPPDTLRYQKEHSLPGLSPPIPGFRRRHQSLQATGAVACPENTQHQTVSVRKQAGSNS